MTKIVPIGDRLQDHLRGRETNRVYETFAPLLGESVASGAYAVDSRVVERNPNAALDRLSGEKLSASLQEVKAAGVSATEASWSDL
ncbi:MULTISPECIES: hypothetical protein [unclassified Bradyrhizobium]